MTAYNLSACITPSLLCPPNSGSLELEDNLIKKISLVAFLIENCLRIFGEDITSLLGENSMSRANSEKAADSGQKTVKSRSFGDRAFCRGCSTCQDNQGTAPPSAKPGQLFGVSLTDVCDKDNLAFPILDFLRNIQGSVFVSDLYDKWLGVIDQGNEEEKITAAQRLLAQLPRANVVLLRYLFGVLYNIEQHSSSNQMTAYNLSVCIAPSLLCPPNSGSLELKDNLIKKISLVAFLIENCLRIFGEDITSLLGENSMSRANSEKAADSGQKTVKSRSFGDRAFGRACSTCQDNQGTAPPSAKPGQLFGVSLTDVCDKDNLAFPILGMLSFLNRRGPLTEGIFSKSANIKSCRILKDKLNSGVKVNPYNESVHVVASVLKDFLRNIPGSVLLTDLYDKWLSVIDQGNEEEKITAAQRLLAQLPRANVVLLRYLFGVLYNIEQHSSSNQMTAYNLSACITPSLLCPPNSGSLELEDNLIKKISLVAFLIENCLRIFGEDITSLLGENSMSRANSEKAADSGQKTVKSRSFGDRAFGRACSTCQDNQGTAPPSAKPGQLFGVSLTDVCDKDNLAFPILGMLSFLNRRGPLTEGIFSKSANIKSCRILKDKLNSGVKVNPYNESVHVVASVLKDFLRNIPGSVLLTDLYDKWLSVIDQGNEEEKITAAQRLLAQLPRANVVLLRYLFGVLYNIEQHSSSNQMTAYNLSACITPSLLCPPNSGSLELEDNLIKKISLVAFLIENCLRIFGEDITSLLGENSMSRANSEKAADSGQKTVKSRSFGDRAFGRACSTCQDNQGTAPPSAKPGQLFGVSLTDVCDKDNLAFPILGMLSFLNRRGPLTEGIFSKSANIKSCRILKDKLNSGVKVNPYNESVHVVASVLKDFLRNIPGSVLLTDLYDKWLGVIDQGNEEEKITAAQRLLAQLPRANVVLLRYLFGVLYNIEQHSSSNQMTAYNLSACIAPSLLCPPKSGSLELEDNLIKKISLVAFLIENCLRIFGEDITSLLGENSMSRANSEKAADSGQKTVKSRSFGDRAFGRACSTCQDNQGTAPPSAKPGQLFGVSLTDVCDKDNLAFPILVGHLILVFYSPPEEGKL
uniref:uncharacterized protein LOC118542029 n=1 Tax=Halichoerus grypus TaxID=9711 RepID=UPI00165977EF|nr:uncharacterized protein LOC118542029 [Halichoerus grypus]